MCIVTKIEKRFFTKMNRYNESVTKPIDKPSAYDVKYMTVGRGNASAGLIWNTDR